MKIRFITERKKTLTNVCKKIFVRNGNIVKIQRAVTNASNAIQLVCLVQDLGRINALNAITDTGLVWATFAKT